MDITERKRSEEALRDHSKRIIEAQENERRRVSRELHDSVNQILASAKFRVESLHEQISRRNTRLRREVQKTRDLLHRVMMEVRRISRNLRPSELDDLGLIAAVRNLADEFSERTGIAIRLRLPKTDPALTPEVELTLYRIIQEALNNVEKHSRASRVKIGIDRNDSSITAVIEDNGKGLAQTKLSRGRHRNGGLGLLDMRERSSFLHGTLEISAGSPRGTVVEVCIPLNDLTSTKRA
jgi:two-component system NarL family sensor kinase